MSGQPKLWQICPPAPPSHLAQFPGWHPIVVQVLYSRGMVEQTQAAAFLAGHQSEPDPFLMGGIPDAVTRVRQALHGGEKIAVYGDFDVDGITAAVLLVQTLRAMGGVVQPYIPHRVDEGYGLNSQALERLARDAVRLVITVDCGVRSIPEAAHARLLNLDMIITDHHSTGPELPPAVAVVDPRQPGNSYPFDELAGVGIAYRLAQALLRAHREDPVSTEVEHLEENDLLDLVALGTVADLVPLRGENRTLVLSGLEQLKHSERPGIEALCRQARIHPSQVDATSISYALGPRLNAAGRMEHAGLAFELLMTRYPAEAERLAGQLDQLNRERQRLTSETLERARQAAQVELDRAPLIFVADAAYPVGVVGLVAGRLSEEFYRPAVVVEKKEKYSRGSARSIAEFHITEALDECADLLVQHGGHAAAAGFTVASENLELLADRLRDLAVQQLDGQPLIPVLSVDADVPLGEMSPAVQRELARMAPFGYDNPPPLFLSHNVRVVRQRTVGGDNQHLKLVLSDGKITWDGIAFRQGEWAGKLPDRLDLVYHLEAHEWRGERQLQLNIQDLRPAVADGGRGGTPPNHSDPTELKAPCTF